MTLKPYIKGMDQPTELQKALARIAELEQALRLIAKVTSSADVYDIASAALGKGEG